MKRKCLFVCTLALCLLAGCGAETVPAPTPTAVTTPSPVPTAEPLDFHDFLAAATAGRKAILDGTAPMDLSAFTVDRPEQAQAWTEAEMDGLLDGAARTGELTQEGAKADAVTFFKLLRTTYGAYDYFGGDEVFAPLEAEVLAALDEAEAPYHQALEELLADTLTPVLRDGHFRIGDQQPIVEHRQFFYYVPDLYFTDPTPYPEEYVKPTIAPDGSIQYWFAALSRDGSDLPDELGGQALRWVKTAALQRYDGPAYKKGVVKGIPVLGSFRMYAGDVAETAQLEEFASSGPAWAEEPLFMLDVRGNPGGSDIYVMNWFEGFFGQAASPRRSGGKLHSQLGIREFGYPSESPGSWRTNASAGAWAETDSTIFVLTDQGTASSGETVVEFMRTAANTLFVGGPTGGCALVLNNVTFYLPNSGLPVYFGTGLAMCETPENRDGVGYLPDLWVEPYDAPSAVARLVAYYGLSA